MIFTVLVGEFTVELVEEHATDDNLILTFCVVVNLDSTLATLSLSKS